MAKLNEQLKFLIELQELDSSIIAMAEKVEAIPRKLEHFSTPLQQANELFQKTKTKHSALNKKKKDKDLQLDEMQDKINKLKSRSSDIKTNKEYEAHKKEIQVFEKNMAKIEDELLVIMEEIEEFEKVIKVDEVKVKKAEDEYKIQEKILAEEQKKIAAELETEKSKRKDFIARLDDENYSQYMNLLKKYGDKVVVETRDEICLGCNTNIPPQLYNDIKKGDALYNCFFCKRYLYIKPPPGSADQSENPTILS
ncbi:MAG: C4-type zinc ribbon domain-containing protein [Nitrospirota bacterium]